MKLPYIGSDLDGTIVKNSDFKILEETVKDINFYQKVSDNKFFIVTGRAFQNMKYYIKQLNVSLPVISSNGGVISDPISGKVFFEHIIDTEIVVDLLNHSIENNLDVNLYTATELCALKNSERIGAYKRLYGHYPDDCQPEFTIYENYSDLIEDVEKGKFKTVKLMFSFDFEKDALKIENLNNYLESRNLYHPTSKLGGRVLVDAMTKDVNKATGVKKWAEIMNIDLNDIHVIGDNNNDIEMITELSYGIAVENAVENLKNIAWKVIGHIEENGVGEYLKHLATKG